MHNNIKKIENNGYSELQVQVARNILEYICKQRLQVNDHMPEQKLAKLYNVSRSPIRGALNLLAEKELLSKETNRGYFLKQDFNTIDIDHFNLSDTQDEKLCMKIKKDWFRKKIPQNFSEAEFRRHYGLGRLSLSRILVKLSEEGIIARNPGKGWRFEPTLNSEELHDSSFEFRLLIEPAAILLPTFKIERGLADLCRRNHQLMIEAKCTDLSRLFEIDAEFHKLIGISCRNPFFLSAIERQNQLRKLVEYESLLETDRSLNSITEHMNILDAIEAGDLKHASMLLQQHIHIASLNKPSFS